jgi:hypothetical protein
MKRSLSVLIAAATLSIPVGAVISSGSASAAVKPASESSKDHVYDRHDLRDGRTDPTSPDRNHHDRSQRDHSGHGSRDRRPSTKA